MKKQLRVTGILVILGICLLHPAGTMQSVKAVEDAAAVQLSEENAAQTEDSSDISEMSQLMTAQEDVDMKTAPEDGAEVIRSYQKGDSVFVTGKTPDGWYRVVYQDKEG